jgi:hypothetical protein
MEEFSRFLLVIFCDKDSLFQNFNLLLQNRRAREFKVDQVLCAVVAEVGKG